MIVVYSGEGDGERRQAAALLEGRAPRRGGRVRRGDLHVPALDGPAVYYFMLLRPGPMAQ